MSSRKAKRFLRWAGTGLSIVAVFFVVAKLKGYTSEINIGLLATVALPLFGLALVYGAANVLLALAWKDLLQHFDLSVSSRSVIRIFGVSQLAKYVPGNIFHFVGRQALGLEAGLPAWPLAKSAIWEMGVLSISGSMFVLWILPYHYPALVFTSALPIFGVTVLTSVWISNRWFSRWIAQVVVWDVVFLTLSGWVFLAVLLLVVPAESIHGSSFVFVCGAYVVAWLAGIVTPGAPAGIGIREVVLYALLISVANEADLLTAIVVGRIVTVAGDTLFYLSALAMNTRVVKTV